MKTPQVTPEWATGIYIGNGVVSTYDLSLRVAIPTQYQGKITKVSKLKNSYNGNPRFAIWLDGLGRFTTPVDAGWVYGISPHTLEGKSVLVRVGNRPNSRTIESLDVEG